MSGKAVNQGNNGRATGNPFNKKPKILYNRKFTTPLKRRRNGYNPEEEARLERIVFGDSTDVIEHLPSESTSSTPESTNVQNDKSRKKKRKLEKIAERNAKKSAKKPVWIDEDDAQYSVEAGFQAQNRKPNEGAPEKFYSELLENKYKALIGTPKWAELTKEEQDGDDIDRDILKHSCHMEKPRLKNLPKNVLDIKAVTPINQKTHNEGPIISTVEFHPTSTVALVAGSSGILSLFQVDGVENNKLHTMRFNKFPISSGKFVKDGTEVLIGSEYYPYCHSYNLMTGKTYKMQLPHGITNMGRYEVSPDGKLLALCGRFGDIYLLNSGTKELIETFKMNAKCHALAFTPDGKSLISHGAGSEMYVWDINSRSCVHRAIDDGCLSCASIAISPSGQFIATGSKEGVVNLYDVTSVLENQAPVPLKIVLNLVTSVTALKFNPFSEVLAMASNKKHNAFKMLHLPSFTVFQNFPTFQTNVLMPEALNFSPASGYLSLSNRSGNAFLYRLKHYGDY